MKKGLTELVFILDRSGSMGGLETDTIGGFNGMLERQKGETGSAIVTTVLFDDRYELIHDGIALEQVKPLTEEQYFVRGCTALLDAVGKTIGLVQSRQALQAEEERAEKVIFVITTDGYENASREYSYKKLKNAIEQKKKAGWEFIFMGANMDAVAEASRFGIAAERAVTYQCDSEGISVNFLIADAALRKMRRGEVVNEEWKAEIEEDVRRRGSSNCGAQQQDTAGGKNIRPHSFTQRKGDCKKTL